MAKVTNISWAHSTFNPWIGCTKVSPACDNCYAEGVAKRMGKKLWGKDADRFFTMENYWEAPLRWNEEAGRRSEPWRVFCGSLCDVMEDRRDLDGRREMLFELIEATPNLTWLLLTKRPENFLKLTPEEWNHPHAWPKNAWAMTTAENQRRLDERLPHLLKVPTEVRGLSIEPLLGPIVLPDTALPCTACRGRGYGLPFFSADYCEPCDACLQRARALDGGSLLGPGKYAKFDTIHWVIVGGESGGKARPMHPAWVRSLRDQCAKHRVAFHMKQWGEWRSPESGEAYDTTNGSGQKRKAFIIQPDGTVKCFGKSEGDEVVVRVGVKKAGRLIDGKLWDQTPQSMVVPV